MARRNDPVHSLILHYTASVAGGGSAGTFVTSLAALAMHSQNQALIALATMSPFAAMAASEAAGGIKNIKPITAFFSFAAGVALTCTIAAGTFEKKPSGEVYRTPPEYTLSQN